MADINATTTTAAALALPGNLGVFTVLLVILGVIALYWVLASSRLSGFFLSFIINRFLPRNERVSIGAFNLSFVQGRIALGSITYTSQNTSTSAVSCFITVRYWRREVQSTFKNKLDLPPRISIEVSGLEMQIFNNSDKFKEIQKLSEEREKQMREGLPTVEERLRQAQREVAEQIVATAVPWYYVAAPAVGIHVVQGAIVLSPMDLHHSTTITFREAHGTLVVSKNADYPADIYKFSLKMNLHRAEVTLIPNSKLVVHKKRPEVNHLNGGGGGGSAGGSGGRGRSRTRLGDDVDEVVGGADAGAKAEADGVSDLAESRADHEGTAGWTEGTKNYIYSNCWSDELNEFTCGASECHILRSPLIKIVYAQDEGGVILPRSTYERDHAPDFSMRVHAMDCVINYGAWANYQRALQQYRFFPEDWKLFSEKIYFPLEGRKRVSGHFKMFVKLSFQRNRTRPYTAFRIPYWRSLYPSEISSGDNRDHAVEWVEARVNGDVLIDYCMPWVTLPEDQGSSHVFTISLADLTVISSFNNAAMLTTDKLVVNGNLFSDNDWRLPALWDIDLSFSKSTIWLLYDHVNMLTDLVRSWTSFTLDPEHTRGLDYFAPIMYTLRIGLVDGFELRLNANQYNIIESHNDVANNAYYFIGGSALGATITMPFVEYEMPSTKIGFTIGCDSPIYVRLSVPEFHSLRSLSCEPDTANFISLEEILLAGSYTYFSQTSDELLDVLDMTVTLTNPTCVLYSYYLKYFLSLKNNYLGAFQSHMTRGEFLGWGKGSTLGHEKTIANALDASVRVHTKGPVSISVPVDMYSSDRTVLASTQHLSIDVRSHRSFMQLQLDVSPISLEIPTFASEAESAIAKSLRMESLPNLEVDGFALSFYLYYGPEPERESYREQFNIYVGGARGQIVAGQISVVLTLLINFFHHLYTWDDELWEDINAYNEEIRRNKLRVLMEVDVAITGLELDVVLVDTLVHLSSTEGARIHYDTRHTAVYTDVILVHVPPVNIHQYLPLTMGDQGLLTDQDDWTDVASIQVGLDIRVVSKRDTWYEEMKDQNDFIIANDVHTGRCKLYLKQVAESLEKLISEEQQGATSSRSPPPQFDDDADASSSSAKKDVSMNVALPGRRCGRRYRASMPGRRTPAYASDPIVFTQDLGTESEGKEVPGSWVTAHRKASTLAATLDWNSRGTGSRVESAVVHRAAADAGVSAMDLRPPQIIHMSSPSKVAAEFGRPPSRGQSDGMEDRGDDVAYPLDRTNVMDFRSVTGRNSAPLQPTPGQGVGTSIHVSGLKSASETGGGGNNNNNNNNNDVGGGVKKSASVGFFPAADSEGEIDEHGRRSAFSGPASTFEEHSGDSDDDPMRLGNEMSAEYRRLQNRIRRLMKQYNKLVDHNETSARDCETTSVFFKLWEHTTIAISPSSISSIHNWLRISTVQLPNVDAMWDSLKVGFYKSNFFAPKHRFEVLRLNVNVPAVRLEFYSTLGEHINAALLLKGVEITLLLDEEMHISGEDVSGDPTMRRGLTALVKRDPVVVESALGGAANVRNDTTLRLADILGVPPESSAANSPPRSPTSPPQSPGGAESNAEQQPTSGSGSAKARSITKRRSLFAPPQLRMSARLGDVAIEGDLPLMMSPRKNEGEDAYVPVEGKSRLNRLDARVQLAQVTFVVFESAEPQPTPGVVCIASLSRVSGTLALKCRYTGRKGASGRKGAGNLVLGGLETSCHSSLSRNIPELLINWSFPVKDLGASLDAFMEVKKQQTQLLIGWTLYHIGTEYNVHVPSVVYPTLSGKGQLARRSWEPVYILRSMLREHGPTSSAFAELFRDAPPMSAPEEYWGLLCDTFQGKAGKESVRVVTASPDVSALFGVSKKASKEDATALELDFFLKVGPIELNASTGYVEMERQSGAKFSGVDGKGKMIWARVEKGRKQNVKIYASLIVRRIKCGLMHTILQYGTIYQRAIVNWHSARKLEIAKRYVMSTESAAAAAAAAAAADEFGLFGEEAVEKARAAKAAAAAAAAKVPPNPSGRGLARVPVVLEIIGATVRIEPIQIQAMSDHGCVLLQVEGATLVYTHTQVLGEESASSSAGATKKPEKARGGGAAIDQLIHSATFSLGSVRLSLHGTPNPDRNALAKDRIAEVLIGGVKISEMMVQQSLRKNKAFSIAGSIDKIDVPFQVGNAGNLGHFLNDWSTETAREEASYGFGGMYDDDIAMGKVPTSSMSMGNMGPAAEVGGVPDGVSDASFSLFTKILVGNVRVHTGDLAALDFMYEIPGIGLDIDVQRAMAFARFVIPLHYIRFGVGIKLAEKQDKGKGEAANNSAAQGSSLFEDQSDLSDLLEGRQIVLPNVNLTAQLVTSWTKAGGKFTSANVNEGEWESSDENDLADNGVVKKEERLSVRAVLGPLKASIRNTIMSEALKFVTKLEKQIEAVAEMWVDAERRKREDPPPSVEVKINKAASRVRSWYQIVVVFSGVNVKFECPAGTALLRLSDVSVQLGNEASQGNVFIPDEDEYMDVAKNFRDFFFVVRFPELSVWVLHPSVRYREGLHDLTFDEHTTMDGILASFMTHIVLSNSYSFERMRPSRSGASKRKTSAADNDDERDDADFGYSNRGGAFSDNEDRGETFSGDKFEVVTLADVLQNVRVQIHNTALVVQPMGPECVTQMLVQYMTAANEFRRGVNDAILSSTTLRYSADTFKEAASSARSRVKTNLKEEGLSGEKAHEFLRNFLQNFSVSLEIINLAVIVPFKNAAYYSALSVDQGKAAAAAEASDGKPAAPAGEAYRFKPTPEMYWHVAGTIDRLTLRGLAGPGAHGSKIVARADLDAFRVGFGTDYDVFAFVQVNMDMFAFQTFDIDAEKLCSSAVRLVNMAEIAQGVLVLYTGISKHGVENVSVELSTSGVKLDLNPSLYTAAMLLKAEALRSLEKSRAAVVRAKFLLFEMRSGSKPHMTSPKQPKLSRHSHAVPATAEPPKPRRRGSLSSSMTAMFGLSPTATRKKKLSTGSPIIEQDLAATPAPHSLSSPAIPPASSSARKSPRFDQIFGRKVVFNLMLKIGTGSCTLHMAQDGPRADHAKSLHEFQFPYVILRVRHSHTPGDESAASRQTHIMGVMDELKVRLPPVILDFVVQLFSQMKSYMKLNAFISDMDARSRPKSPRPSSPRKDSGSTSSASQSPRSPRSEGDGGVAPIPVAVDLESSANLAEKSASPELDGGSAEDLSLHELLNVESGLGQVTFAVTLKGLALELDCSPISEVRCSFILGRIDMIMSSAEELENLPLGMSSRNYLNVTLRLQSAEMKIHNIWITTDTVGIDVRDISGNIGRRQEVFEDEHKESVVSAFLGIRSVGLAFAMASLKSWFVVQKLWVKRLQSIPFPVSGGDEDVPLAAAAASSGKPGLSRFASLGGVARERAALRTQEGMSLRATHKVATTPVAIPDPSASVPVASPSSRNRVLIALGLHLGTVAAEANLGLVGTSSTKLGPFSARLLMPIGVAREIRESKQVSVMTDSAISLMYMEVSLRHVSLTFMGKLQGELILSALSIVGERSANAMLSNELELTVKPLRCDLYHKASQIIFADTGDIRLSINDTPEGAVSAVLVSDKLHLQMSAESITAANNIVRRLQENVAKCKADASVVIQQANRLVMDYGAGEVKTPIGPLLKRESVLKKKSSTSFVRNVLDNVASVGMVKVSLKLEVSGSDLSVALFADVMKDAQWIQLNVSSYEVVLSIDTDKPADGAHQIKRDLVLKVGTAVVARMVENEANSANNWVRASRADSILEFPASSLAMRTTQALSGPRRRELDCWFVTEFGATIMVTLRVELYEFLADLASTLKGKIVAVQAEQGPSGQDSRRQPKVPLTPKTPGGSTKYTMQVNKFILEPRVNVLENLTPYALGKVFELLKIGDPQSMIPQAVHGALTSNLEKLLFAVKDVFHRIDQQYAPKPRIRDISKQDSQQKKGPAASRSGAMTPGSTRFKETARTKSRSNLNATLTSGLNVRPSPTVPRLTPALPRLDTLGTPEMGRKADKGGNSALANFSLLDE